MRKRETDWLDWFLFITVTISAIGNCVSCYITLTHIKR